MTNEVNKVKKANIVKILFIAFLIFYIIIGIQVSYNYETTENDLLFDSDPVRVIEDMTNIFGYHYRVAVHPLIVILIQPIYFIIKGIVLDKMIALILMSAAVSALSVVFLYKTILLCSKNRRTSLLISIGYGLTFSNLIFTSTIELYNIAVLGLIALWYFIAKKIKEGWNKEDLMILVALGILSVAVTITNYAVFLIGIIILLLSKRIKWKKFLAANILVVIFVIGLSYLQSMLWQNTPIITDLNSKNGMQREQNFIDYNINMEKVENVVKDCLYNPIISADMKLGTKPNFDNDDMIRFEPIGMWNKIVISAFFVAIMYLTIKNFKKNLCMNIGIILALIFNVLLHVFYGNDGCFLYSLHFVYLIFLLFGINCVEKETTTKVEKTIVLSVVTLLLATEVIVNALRFFKVLKILDSILVPNYFINHFGFLKCLIATCVGIAIMALLVKLMIVFINKLKKSSKEENRIKYLTFTTLMIILIESNFVLLQTIPKYGQVLGMEIGENSQIRVNQNYKLFQGAYKKEADLYLKYIVEYKKLNNECKDEINYELPATDSYFFGMKNRKKMVFKESCLIDLQTGGIVKQFAVDTFLVIPNEYTVLIREKGGQFAKIYENNEGVFIEENGEKKIVEGTNVNIDIDTFDKQKYHNIKRELQGRVLINENDKEASEMLSFILNKTGNSK